MGRKAHPYWKLHTIEGKAASRWRCRYCNGEYSGAANRLVAHLSKIGGSGIGGCEKVPRELAERVTAENNLKKGGVTIEQLDDIEEVLLASNQSEGTSSAPASGQEPSRKRPRMEASCTPFGTSESSFPGHGVGSSSQQSTLPSRVYKESWVKERQKIAEIEIARTLIECNISFNVLRIEQWKRMVRAIAAVGSCEDWSGVSYKAMRTKMLDEEKARIDLRLQPVRDNWRKFGCTILSDGWADTRRRHMINILVSSCFGTLFLRAVDAGKAGESITGDFIYEHIRQAILDVGPENVVQVVTDNASNCKRMGELVETEFPRIVWTPCAAHCLDLLMEDVGKLSWMQPILSDANRITTFFRKKHKALALFRSKSPTLDMVRFSKTRFAYAYMVLERLLKLQNVLQSCAVDATWKAERSWMTSESIKYIQRKLLDECFWEDITKIVKLLKPLYFLLRMTDMEGATMGLLYHKFRSMRQEIARSTVMSTDRIKEISDIIDTRWAWMARPIHGIAGLLHPLYRTDEVTSNPELLTARDHYLETVYSEDHTIVNKQMVSYMHSLGASFSRLSSLKEEETKTPIDWWLTYGYSTPNLMQVAIRILSQDCSAGACERNWSAYSLVHTKIRNRLSTRQMERLVYCRANMRLVRSFKKLDHPMQVDPLSLEHRHAEGVEQEESATRLRSEEEEIFRMLHRELETIDRRVTRARSRVYGIELSGSQAQGDHIVLPRARSRRGPKRGTRRGRGGRGNVIDHAETSLVAVDGEVESSTHGIGSSSCLVIAEPEYDSDGNVLTEGDMPSDSSSSSGFDIDD